jgi:hypothetical protein
VDHVRSLTVTYQPQTADAKLALDLGRILTRSLDQPGDAPERESDQQSWLDRALIYSGPHDISVQLA